MFRCVRGESQIAAEITPMRSERFGVDVLPGHPALSQIEDLMSDSWQSALGRQTGPFNRTVLRLFVIEGVDQ